MSSQVTGDTPFLHGNDSRRRCLNEPQTPHLALCIERFSQWFNQICDVSLFRMHRQIVLRTYATLAGGFCIIAFCNGHAPLKKSGAS